MAPSTRFAAAISALSALAFAQSYDAPVCAGTTTVYTTVTVPYGSSGAAPTSASYTNPDYAIPNLDDYKKQNPHIDFPTYSDKNPNPNGPYYNPNDYQPPLAVWPGKPTSPAQKPAPRPSAPYTYGGPSSSGYIAPAWIPKNGGYSLKPALDQKLTNGNSYWGTLQCPVLGNTADEHPPLPPRGGSGSASYGSGSASSGGFKPSSGAGFSVSGFKPSGTKGPSGFSTQVIPSRTASSFPTITLPSTSGNNSSTNGTSSACGPIPDTGATRTYNFHVSKETVAPDGVVKNGLVVNGQFPGPLIEANWGDWIEVIVTNDMSDEGTSLHWHGLLQKDTPWFDGVPSVSQCPIAPGDTLVYKFRADVFGSSWYHSHYSAQYAGGALGPIVIHGPKTQDYDVDLGPVMVSDWYHDDYFTLVNRTMNGIISFSNNILINGKMNYPCQNTTFACTPNAGVSKFSFTSGKKHLLRIINTSAEAMIKFSIDGHTMKVVANDFVPIQPYDTNVVTVGVGQRSDVIVEATGASTDLVWMRADATGCAFTDGVSPQGVAGVYYESANEDDVPSSTSSVAASALTDCGNDPLSQTQPFCPQTALDSNPTVQNIDITFGNNGTNFVWFMNNQSFHGDYNAPVLQQANEGNLTFPAEWNVFNFASAGSVRLILKSFFTAGAHPMHLHGHNFHVLDEGFGDWDGVITNPSNPQTRDVQLLRPAQDANTPSYIVMQWTQDNPGVWPMHCHIAWHVSGGLYINVLERPDDIQKMTIDHSVADTCQKWDAWSAANVVDQIDSGL